MTGDGARGDGAVRLPISEVFGPTIQGEGPSAGRVAWFVRLGGCNLSCAWCDTPYTWDASRFDLRHEIRQVAVDEVAARIPSDSLVIVTGGEPLLQQGQPAWRSLLERLTGQGCRIQLETNGTIAPNTVSRDLVELFVVSPKLTNAGRHRGHQRAVLDPGWVEVAQAGQACLKIVCVAPPDVLVARRLADLVRWPRRQVWVMPEGTTQDTLADRWPRIAAAAAGHGLNATHRLHVLAWNEKRGH